MTKRFRIVAPALVALVVLLAGSAVMVRADNHDDVFYACLYAGSLTRVNNNGPLANCGRGVNVSWEGNDEVGFNYTVQRNGNSVVSSGLVAGPIVNSVAECEEDESATGGGWEITARSNVSTLDVHRSQGWDSVNEVASLNGEEPTGWRVTARNTVGANSSITFHAIAICTGTAVPPA